ncbi:MAG: hypothetical protein ACK53L_21010, partial [Pirellulaceae bacterium]
SNPINVSTFAGAANNRGAIEGGRAQQVTENGAGVGEVSGPITLAGALQSNWAHFSAGEGPGSALRVSGAVTAPAGIVVQARSSNTGGYVEFTNAGNSFDRFNISNGTVRLGVNNALVSG